MMLQKCLFRLQKVRDFYYCHVQNLFLKLALHKADSG